MLEHEAREDYAESKVGANSREFLETIVNKDSCLSSTDNSRFRSYTTEPSTEKCLKTIFYCKASNVSISQYWTLNPCEKPQSKGMR